MGEITIRQPQVWTQEKAGDFESPARTALLFVLLRLAESLDAQIQTDDRNDHNKQELENVPAGHGLLPVSGYFSGCTFFAGYSGTAAATARIAATTTTSLPCPHGSRPESKTIAP
jgi:hypothetical protein